MRSQYVAGMAKEPSAAPPPPKRLHPVAIRLDDEMLAELRALANEETRPVANLIVALVKEALAARRKRAIGTPDSAT
jgi:hypothetical protein